MKLRKLAIPFLVLAVAGGLAGCSNDGSSEEKPPTASEAGHDHEHDHGHDHGYESGGGTETAEASPRVVISTDTGVVVLDENLKEIDKFDIGPHPTLSKYGDNRHVAAVLKAEDKIYTIDGGSWASAHGDHYHFFVADPAQSDQIYAGTKPSHIVGNLGATAIFFDGTGEVLVVTNDHIGHGQGEQILVKTKGAQHGVAVAQSDGQILVTQPSTEGDQLPDSVELLDRDGNAVKSFKCSELHGEAPAGSIVGFGCADSVLIIKGGVGASIPNPDSNGRAKFLVTNQNGTTFVGNYSDQMLLFVKDGKSSVIDLGVEYGNISAASDGTFVTLGTDGKVYVIDKNGEVSKSIQVMGTWQKVDSGQTGFSPQVAAGGYRGAATAWVVDPDSEKVFAIDLGLGKVTATAEVSGNPDRIVVTNS